MSATETSSKVLDQVYKNIRQATESNLKLQQEFFRQWTSFWPVTTSQNEWTESIRAFQKQWTGTVAELAKKHREVVDKQYQAAIESLEAALNVSESATPEEYRRRSEELCRKTLDCMRELSEAQVHEFQEAVSKWTDLVMKSSK